MKKLTLEEGKMGNEDLQTEIGDLIADIVPQGGSDESLLNNEGGSVDDSQGQERTPQAASGQEPTGTPGTEEGTAAVGEQSSPPATPPTAADALPKGDTQPPAAPATPPPSASAPQKTPTELELERFKKENEELRAHLEEVAGKVLTPSQPQVAKTPEQIEAEKQKQLEAARQVLAFLPDETRFDEVLKNKDNFNALLTAVVNTAVERSLRLMPTVAGNLVEQKITLNEAVRSFYTDNSDLIPHKKYIGFIANEITAQHPDWALQQILQETEKVARERLRIARGAQVGTPSAAGNGGTISRAGGGHTPPQNPGFVPSASGGGRRGSGSADGNLTAVEKDIMSLIS